ncbi:hypothetical protein LTR10_005624 [Elasticomyces elasticus]|nr:hypothetical protein LTR10_005624 [Elasticomyces elasticus]KAK4976363.1 hypothetical protein LTR42_003992 [Elasticomyces elasticus]
MDNQAHNASTMDSQVTDNERKPANLSSEKQNETPSNTRQQTNSTTYYEGQNVGMLDYRDFRGTSVIHEYAKVEQAGPDEVIEMGQRKGILAHDGARSEDGNGRDGGKAEGGEGGGAVE